MIYFEKKDIPIVTIVPADVLFISLFVSKTIEDGWVCCEFFCLLLMMEGQKYFPIVPPVLQFCITNLVAHWTTHDTSLPQIQNRPLWNLKHYSTHPTTDHNRAVVCQGHKKRFRKNKGFSSFLYFPISACNKTKPRAIVYSYEVRTEI